MPMRSRKASIASTHASASASGVVDRPAGSTARASRANRQRASVEAPAQRFAVEELGDDEGPAVVGADVVDGEDVGVRDRRNRARLAFEPREAVGVLRERVRQYLDGDRPVEARVAGLVDLAHPACADGKLDLVRTETRAGGKGHEYPRL
jgi:hypothetical protein